MSESVPNKFIDIEASVSDDEEAHDRIDEEEEDIGSSDSSSSSSSSDEDSSSDEEDDDDNVDNRENSSKLLKELDEGDLSIINGANKEKVNITTNSTRDLQSMLFGEEDKSEGENQKISSNKRKALNSDKTLIEDDILSDADSIDDFIIQDEEEGRLASHLKKRRKAQLYAHFGKSEKAEMFAEIEEIFGDLSVLNLVDSAVISDQQQQPSQFSYTNEEDTTEKRIEESNNFEILKDFFNANDTVINISKMDPEILASILSCMKLRLNSYYFKILDSTCHVSIDSIVDFLMKNDIQKPRSWSDLILSFFNIEEIVNYSLESSMELIIGLSIITNWLNRYLSIYVPINKSVIGLIHQYLPLQVLYSIMEHNEKTRAVDSLFNDDDDVNILDKYLCISPKQFIEESNDEFKYSFISDNMNNDVVIDEHVIDSICEYYLTNIELNIWLIEMILSSCYIWSNDTYNFQQLINRDGVLCLINGFDNLYFMNNGNYLNLSEYYNQVIINKWRSNWRCNHESIRIDCPFDLKYIENLLNNLFKELNQQFIYLKETITLPDEIMNFFKNIYNQKNINEQNNENIIIPNYGNEKEAFYETVNESKETTTATTTLSTASQRRNQFMNKINFPNCVVFIPKRLTSSRLSLYGIVLNSNGQIILSQNFDNISFNTDDSNYISTVASLSSFLFIDNPSIKPLGCILISSVNPLLSIEVKNFLLEISKTYTKDMVIEILNTDLLFNFINIIDTNETNNNLQMISGSPEYYIHWIQNNTCWSQRSTLIEDKIGLSAVFAWVYPMAFSSMIYVEINPLISRLFALLSTLNLSALPFTLFNKILLFEPLEEDLRNLTSSTRGDILFKKYSILNKEDIYKSLFIENTNNNQLNNYIYYQTKIQLFSEDISNNSVNIDIDIYKLTIINSPLIFTNISNIFVYLLREKYSDISLKVTRWSGSGDEYETVFHQNKSTTSIFENDYILKYITPILVYSSNDRYINPGDIIDNCHYVETRSFGDKIQVLFKAKEITTNEEKPTEETAETSEDVVEVHDPKFNILLKNVAQIPGYFSSLSALISQRFYSQNESVILSVPYSFTFDYPSFYIYIKHTKGKEEEEVELKNSYFSLLSGNMHTNLENHLEFIMTNNTSFIDWSKLLFKVTNGQDFFVNNFIQHYKYLSADSIEDILNMFKLKILSKSSTIHHGLVLARQVIKNKDIYDLKEDPTDYIKSDKVQRLNCSNAFIIWSYKDKRSSEIKHGLDVVSICWNGYKLWNLDNVFKNCDELLNYWTKQGFIRRRQLKEDYISLFNH